MVGHLRIMTLFQTRRMLANKNIGTKDRQLNVKLSTWALNLQYYVILPRGWHKKSTEPYINEVGRSLRSEITFLRPLFFYEYPSRNPDWPLLTPCMVPKGVSDEIWREQKSWSVHKRPFLMRLGGYERAPMGFSNVFSWGWEVAGPPGESPNIRSEILFMSAPCFKINN